MSITQLLGGCREFVHNDKVYKVSPINQNFKAKFEQRLVAMARKEASATRDALELSTDEYVSLLRQINDAKNAGHYSFESVSGQEIAKTVPGILMLCCLLFGLDENEMRPLVMERTKDIGELVSDIIKDSYPHQAKEAGEKKAKEADLILTG